MEISYKQIGANIKKARLSAGFTQEMLAEKIGISSVFYGRLERGERKPSLDFLHHTAQALGVSLFSLLNHCLPDFDFDLDNAPQSSYIQSLMRLFEKSSEQAQRTMYSVCWLLAADL